MREPIGTHWSQLNNSSKVVAILMQTQEQRRTEYTKEYRWGQQCRHHTWKRVNLKQILATSDTQPDSPQDIIMQCCHFHPWRIQLINHHTGICTQKQNVVHGLIGLA